MSRVNDLVRAATTLFKSTPTEQPAPKQLSNDAFNTAALDGTLKDKLAAFSLSPELSRAFDAQLATLDGELSRLRQNAREGLPLSTAYGERVVFNVVEGLRSIAVKAGVIEGSTRPQQPTESFDTAQPARGPRLDAPVNSPAAHVQRDVFGTTAIPVERFYDVSKDDPSFGLSPSVPRGGLNPQFVGRVLSRSAPEHFEQLSRGMAAVFLQADAESLKEEQVWHSNFFQGLLLEVKRRTGVEPQFGDVSFARLEANTSKSELLAIAAKFGLSLDKSLDLTFAENYCD